MQCAIGQDGIIIKRFRWWPTGSSPRKPVGEKKETPAITFPQVREAIALLLHSASQCDGPIRIARERTRRLQRNQLARYYHHKQRNLLAPLASERRQI